MNKHALILVGCILAALVAVGCHRAHQPTSEPVAATAATALAPLDLPDVLPSGFTAETDTQRYDRASVFNRINGAAELFLELGFVSLKTRTYHREKAVFEINLFEMDGPTAAWGIYTLKRGIETPLPDVPGQHTGNALQVIAWKGRHFVTIDNMEADRSLRKEMTAITRDTLALLPPETPMDLTALLEADEIVPGSTCVLRGPFSLQSVAYLGDGDMLSLGGRHFGVAADIASADGHIHTRIAIRYDRDATAQAALDHLANNLDDHYELRNRTANTLTYKDHRGLCNTAWRADNRLTIDLQQPCK